MTWSSHKVTDKNISRQTARCNRVFERFCPGLVGRGNGNRSYRHKREENAILSSITHNAVLIFMVICLLQYSSGYVTVISRLSSLRCFTVQASMNLTTINNCVSNTEVPTAGGVN